MKVRGKLIAVVPCTSTHNETLSFKLEKKVASGKLTRTAATTIKLVMGELMAVL